MAVAYPAAGGVPPGLGPTLHGPAGVPGGGAVGSTLVSSEFRQEILTRIGDQVKQLIVQAKRETEAKVRTELKTVNDAMMAMDARLDLMLAQLDELEVQPQQAALEHGVVVRALAKVEQQWGKELGKLKMELHQTIYAHNHNADLMKIQKDALDKLRTDIDRQRGPAQERVKAARAQLAKVDALQKATQKQKRLEPLFQRLMVLEQRVAVAWRWPVSPLLAGGGGPPIPAAAAVAAGNAAAAAAAARAPQQPAAKARGSAAAARHGQVPPGVPPPGVTTSAAATAALAAAATAERIPEKPAFRYPTDEEVQAQLAKTRAKRQGETEADPPGDGGATEAAPTSESAPLMRPPGLDEAT